MNYIRTFTLMFALFMSILLPFTVNVDNLHAQELLEEESHSILEEGHSDGFFNNYDLFEFENKEYKVTENISGDIVIAANNVEINANVDGDILVAADSFSLTGVVFGSVVVLGDNITINGLVDRNLYVGGNNINIGEDARIMGRSYIGGENVEIGGILNNRLYVYGKDLNLQAQVNGNTAISSEKYYIAESAQINGDVTIAGIENPGNILGTITGETKYEKAATAPDIMVQSLLVPEFSLMKFVVGLFSLFVVIYFMISFWPKKVTTLYHEQKTHTLKNFGIGILWYVLLPVLMIFFLSTFIGINLAITLFGLFVVFISLSQAVTALFLGMRIIELRMIKKSLSAKNEISLMSSLFVGAGSYIVLVHIPYIRVLVYIFGFVYGAGVLTQFLKSTLEIKK